MDESHFENAGARIFKYCFFALMLAITGIGLWQKEAILGYFSFREHGEARIVIHTLPGTQVSVVEEGGKKRELGLVGRDGKFTMVEQGAIQSVRVHLYHPYYFPEEKLFETVKKGEISSFQANLVPLLGSLHVQSFPSGAILYVEDKEVGTTPWMKRDIRDGTRLWVEVRLEGYIPQYREVVIEGGKEESVVFSLVSSEASISLETDKESFDFSSLRIFVDGFSFALTGQVLRFVEPGRHRIEVVAYDGLKLEKEINIKPGQTLHLELPDWFVEDGG